MTVKAEVIMTIQDRIGAIVDAPRVQKLITALVIINAAILGLETWEPAERRFGNVLRAIDTGILWVFVTEIAAKMTAQGQRFFKSGWNLFDFIIVGIALIPTSGALSVLRALRILRALRLLSVVPQMRTVVSALLHAVPGMLSVGAIIALIFYVGSVLTTNLYGENFPQWFGSVGRSMYTLFQIMTLESWSMGIVRPVMEMHPYAWIFFITFILATSFTVLNLFIGIIVDAMQMQHQAENQEHHDDSQLVHGDIQALRMEIADLSKEIQRLNHKT